MSKEKIDIFWLVIILSAVILMNWQIKKTEFCKRLSEKWGIEHVATTFNTILLDFEDERNCESIPKKDNN